MNEQVLQLRGVSVAFGGVIALTDVSFDVAVGSLHALIGPNGAGKSSCFNAITGLYPLSSGQVLLDGKDLRNVAVHRRTVLGLTRTFQNIVLAEDMTVRDNLALGRHRLMRSTMFASAVHWPPSRAEERRHQHRIEEISEFVGIRQYLPLHPRSLPYGVRKRIELARALCAEPRILLLDEPVAGMNAEETREMAQLLFDVKEALSLTLVLVEHDMGMVMSLAERVTVLDFGRVIADGSPEEVRNDPDVIRAYLGAAGQHPEEGADTHEPA